MGGFRGHVLAVDADYDGTHDDEDTTEYDGQIRILDQLVWTDLYAMTARQSQ